MANIAVDGLVSAAGAGNQLGDAAADTIAFYGATPVSQRATSIQATSVISAYSSTTASALIGTLLVEIANTLNGLGLWKGAA